MKKDKDTSCRWTEADEATLVHSLASSKAKGHWGDNGFKKEAWNAAFLALDGSEKISLGTPKTAGAIKSRWQRLKQDYEIVKMLRNRSGFGWDDVKKTVTAPDSVWDELLETERYKKAKPFRNKKCFRLYDEVAEIAGHTRATGENATSFGATPGGSHTQSRSPSPFVPIDPALLALSDSKTQAVSDNDSGEEIKTQVPKPGPARKAAGASFFEGDKYSDSEDDDLTARPQKPLAPTRKRSESEDTKPKERAKRQRRVTAGEGMSHISSSMREVAESVAAAAAAKRETPQVFAIRAIQADKSLSRNELADAVECIMGDANFANAYLAVDDPEVRSIILRRKVGKVADKL